MARTDAGAILTTEHRRAQVNLRAAALREYLRLWPLWQGDERTFNNLVMATIPVMSAYHDGSATIAAAYYRSFRSAERVPGAATPLLAQPLDTGALAGSLYVTGRDMTRQALDAGHSPESAMRAALVRTSGTITRFVLGAGRDTIVRSVVEDREARGWARVTSAKPCAFCARLAARGPVYNESSVRFRSHDHCACAAEPHYDGSAWPGRANEFRDLLDQNPDPNAFRQALEATPA